ncbi:hypothetical protein [Bacteroides pyogenes]|uniref:hypothetical protein n=1 Tax=Bacteroides pyogenes TaxID=310300 RepID=UPI002A90FB01|nr:hypothetical protein [Bacteroides pyogenes]MDY5433700.1 hypothetical protein [Bacteroides pyogenes]
MKELTLGTHQVPASDEKASALTERVNNLQHRYYRSLAPDCEVKTSSDAYYVSAIACICLTFIFPPCVLAAGYCLYKAKKGGRS